MADDDDFAAFLARRVAASTAFVEGDVGPLLAVSASSGPASIFGPRGDTVVGPEQVNAANSRGAQSFAAGSSTNVFEVMHSEVDRRLAYWVGLQRSTVRFAGSDEPVAMVLRLTEVYRREEDGGWVLVHRHADPLATP